MATGTVMTAEQFDRLPAVEGRRSELFEGELVELSSATLLHNYVLLILGATLVPLLSRLRLGMAVPNTEFIFGDNRFQPDLAVLLGDKWKHWDLERVPVGLIPDIAVEVVSPSESATYIERKTRIYLEHGVAEAWCIYPEARRIYVQTPSSIRILKEDETLSTPLLPDWSVTVRDLFPVQ
jgi:Uma2 family endonuclease